MPQTIIPHPPFQLSESTRPDCDFACCSNSEILAQIGGKTYTSEFYCTTDITPGPEDAFILADESRLYSLTAAGRSSTITQLRLRSDEKDLFASMSIRKVIAFSHSRDLAIVCQVISNKRPPTNAAFRLCESKGSYGLKPLFEGCGEILGIQFVDDSVVAAVGSDDAVTVYKEDAGVIAAVERPYVWDATISTDARYVCWHSIVERKFCWVVLDCETGSVKSVGDAALATMSPDGRQIAAIARGSEAMLIDWMSESVTPVSRKAPADKQFNNDGEGYYNSPSWSRDGDHVSFIFLLRDQQSEWSRAKYRTVAWIVSLSKRTIFPVSGIEFPTRCALR